MREMNDFNALDMAVLNSRASFLQNRGQRPAAPLPTAPQAAPQGIAAPPRRPSLLRDRVQQNVKGLAGNWWKRLTSQFGG